MAVRSYAAPPTSWSHRLVEPTIDQTAYVHSFSNISGDVRVGANVVVAPGTSIRADDGNPFHIGEGTNIQDGVVIHGLEQGRVVGDDDQSYSVWIGKNSSITHMALVHGPAYVGDDCFIGFRSTVFNARIGHGCIVMMHTLIQDVEIPPGRYVPSGSIVTTQQQADRLPVVQDADLKFASHVLHINDALRSGHHSAENVARITPIRDELGKPKEVNGSAMANYSSNRLNPETIDQVRRLLNQGYRIGTEHADERRFQTSSWKSCAPIQTHRESEVIAGLEACLNEHAGEYVRLIGIDTKVKRRVLESIIQRPSDKPGQPSSANSQRSSGSSYSSRPFSSSNGQTSSGSGLTSDVVSHVRSLLSQGYRIGMEHADERRFQTSSWKSCSPIQSNRESEVIAGLEACLNEHTGEYVRLIGIDTKVKRRVSETIIQRPPGKNGGSKPQSTPQASSYSSQSQPSNGSRYSGHQASPSAALSPEVVAQVRQLLGQGAQISTEHADERRFKTSSWQSGGTIQSNRETDIFSALEGVLSEHGNHYVRLIGIDPKAKKRVSELVIHRPSKKATR